MKLRRKELRKAQARSPARNGNGDVIGIDLGAGSVRAAVLGPGTEDGRPSVTVRGVGSVALPPGAVVNGEVLDQASVTDALRQLWAVNGFKSRRVILGVANPQVVVRPLQVPDLSAQQRAKALPFQAREIIALPLEEVVLDYVQLGDPDPTTGMVSGLLIATPRSPVLAAVQAVERAGLKVAGVDLSCFGALRSIGDGRLVVEAVIDLGAHLTSIVIHDNGVPRLVRTLAHGGQELTELLVAELDLSLREAEQAKCEAGLTGKHSAATDALQSGIRPLLAEIRSSINYFRAGAASAQLEGISLTGGGSALPGLAAELTGQNGVPTQVVAPLQHLGERHPDHPPGPGGTAVTDPAASAVSIGLAMGAAA